MSAEIFHLPVPEKLTPDQREYWWDVLETAERQREYAMRMLGILAVERGLSETDERLVERGLEENGERLVAERETRVNPEMGNEGVDE